MDPITALSRSFDAAFNVIAAVEDDQWALPTPCTEWDARALGNHLMGGALMVATCVPGDEIDPSVFADDLLGEEPAASYRAVADQAAEAFTDDPSVLGKMVKMPFGEMPGGAVAAIFASDHFTHAWDLAKATGQSTDLDPELAEYLLESSKGFVGEDFRKPGFFGTEVSAPAGATAADRLAAFLGRSV